MKSFCLRMQSSILPMLLFAAGLFLGACSGGGGGGEPPPLHRLDPPNSLDPPNRSWLNSFRQAISRLQIPMLTIGLDWLSRFPAILLLWGHLRRQVMRLG